MYSFEIDNAMKSAHHIIDSVTYAEICETSPQIKRVRYRPDDDLFEIWTKDGYYWEFTVYRKTFDGI